LDEVVYVDCGLAYVANLTAPYSCNFEHPPLGKYLIGFLELFGLGRFFFLFLLLCSSILAFLISRHVLESGCLAFLVAAFIMLDTVFVNTFRHLLLDPPTVSPTPPLTVLDAR
jgi:predicted membrane-bound dolichyl-phosphate-mannose-protein mannosyltransferase